MPTTAEYEAWKNRQQQANVGKANIVLGQGFAHEPDQFAADLNFAKEASTAVGNPVPLQMVQDPDTRSVFERIVAEKKQSTVLSSSPMLADWLRTPGNAELTRDDLEGLGWWETATGAAANAAQRGVTRLPVMYNQWMAEGAAQRAGDASRSFGDIYGQERATVGVEGKLIDTAVGPVTDLLSAGSRFLTSRLSAAFGGDQEQAAAYYQQQAGEITNQIAAIPMSPAASTVRDAIGALEPTGDVMADVGNFLQVIGNDPGGFTAFLTETAIETAPTLAAAFATGVVTRNPAVVAGTLGTLSGLQERYTAPVDFLKERGIDVSTPEGAMAAITNPELMAAAAERGVIRGLIIGSLDTISGGVAGEVLARNPVLNLALQSVIQAAFGGGGEAGAQIASGQPLNVSDVLIEAMAEFVTAPIDVGSMAAAKFSEGVRAAAAAGKTTAVLEEIAAQASASVTRTRSPDTFRDFVATVTAGGSRENMFVPALEFNEYFQSRGIDPFELADQLAGMGRDDLQTAIDTGGSVQIPTATWAADMAGSEHDAFIIQNSAFDPGAMTGTQAAEFEATKNDLLSEAWAEAEAVRQDAEMTRQIYDQERDRMVGELRAAGRATDVATAEALPMVEFRRVMAGRMGLTPEEFAARYPLAEVRGQRPEGLDPKNVDELTRTLTEARARRTVGLDTAATPLLEFISARGGITDPGGELRARDAVAVKRRGKKTLRLERRSLTDGMASMFGIDAGQGQYGMDNVARAAVEAGFMADDPDVLAWQEAMRSGSESVDLTAALLRAIDGEMRGEVEAPVDNLGGIEEYLAGLGVALTDSDADIRAAIEGDAEGRAYGQSEPSLVFASTDMTKTPEFKRWFGDSKVVGADGEPLVVYHGSGQKFEAFDPNARASTEGGMILADAGVRPFFFSSRQEVAQDFAGGDADYVMPVYLSIKNPLVIEAAGLGWEQFRDQIVAAAKGGEYDGVILRNLNDSMFGDMENPVSDVFAAFEPTQIKSVNNRGTFDANDPRILFQPAYHGTPHLFEKFSTDHIGAGEGNQAFGWGLYFAGKKEIAEFYRDKLSSQYRSEEEMSWGGKTALQHYEAAERRSEYGKMAVLESIMLHQPKSEIMARLQESIADGDSQAIDGLKYVNSLPKEAFPETGGRLFEVDIPDDSEMLNWEKELTKQSPAVKQVLKASGLLKEFKENLSDYSSPQNTRGVGRGDNLYQYLSWKLGGDKAASQRLREIGIPGHKYPAGTIANVKGGGHNYVIYDDSRVAVRSYKQADAGFQGGGARGSIQFPGAGVSNGQTIISLFKTADLTTFLHETGHYFLTVARDAAALDPTGPIASDFDAVKAWWRDNADAVARDAGGDVTADDVRMAIDNGTTGDVAKDMAIDTGMQEQFARATEQYFMEGKAPSAALKQAFEKFRAWLVSIYKSIRGLNVNVSDEMRAVFDRMLATDAEIQQARTDAGTDIALTADDLGMTAEQFASFTKLRDQAQTDATARTLDEAMRPIRRAATAAYKAERAKVRARIETETKQQPVYRAIQELRFGKSFDGEDVTPLKLDRAIIEAQYGGGYIPYLPGATKDGRGHRNAVFSTEGGVHPDIAASAYGFPTGRDMLDRMANAPEMDALIEAETNKEMEFRHNDPLKDGSIQQQAMDNVHNDLQGQVLAARLDAFNEIAGTDRGLTHKAAREAARRSLRGMAIKDATRAERFLAAERKAAAEVAKLSASVTRTSMWMDAARRRVAKQARGAVREGDAQAALSVAPKLGSANESTARYNEQADALVEASRRQLLNHMLYSEARKVAAETDATIKRVSMLRKANARLSKTRDINFVLAARAVAGRFGMTKPDTAFDFKAWMDQLRFDDPVTASAMVQTIETYSQDAKPYKDLTVAEFGAVKDAIESLLTLAKTTRALEIDGARVDRQDAIDALIAQAEPRAKMRAGSTAAPTRGEKKKLSALTTGAALVRTEAWARDMDDGKAGVFTRYLVKPVMDALGEYRQARTVRLDELLAIVEPRRGELLGKAVAAPELGYTFENKGALLHALLHTGNESNKKKLLLGRGWSKGMINAKPAMTKQGKPRVDRQGNAIMDKGTLDTSQWDAMVERLIADGTITAADKKMIEDIWALMDSLKRPAQTAHKRIYGHYFAEIEAAPFTNSLGTWRGGYVPAIIDQYASIDAGKQDAAAALDSQMDASMFPTTGSGFTKGRVEYNQPLALNLQSLPGHMDKVLRFTHLEPTIRQTASLLADRGLRETVSAVNRDAIDAILTPWLVRTARQAVEAPAVTASGRQFGNVMRVIRKRVGLHMMAINVVNAAQQVTGIPSAAVLVKIKHLKGATVRFAKDAGTMRTEAIEASDMMRDRMDNSSRMTGQEIDKIIVEPTIPAEVDRFVSQHGYILQQGTQNVVDLIVWHAGYDQAIAQGMTDADAVFEADSVVRRTQGSFNPEDVSAFETGTAFQRVFTMFTSYFNTQLNLLGGEAMTTIRTMGWSGGPKLFHLYFFGIMIPAVVAEAISLAARGELGDEDDDGLADDMLELFLGSQVKFLAGMVPLVGTLTVAALNKFNDQPFDDQLSVSPANYLLERAVGAPGTIAGAITGNGSASKATADGITALGLILGVPTGQLAKSVSYVGKVAEGRAEPQNVGDVLRGITSGRDGTE